jgi:hypothetical protein
MTQPAPLYIIASPRPRTGKTLLARLLMEFLQDSRRPLVGFDLNIREPTLAERFPKLVWPIDIGDTRGQMGLFDRLLADTSSSKVVDLGYGAFDQFFAVIREIGFVQEAQRRAIEPIVLFITDSTPTTIRYYGELQRRLPGMAFVPVHNESVSLMFANDDFPPTRPQYGMIRVARLSPIVRGVVDRPNFLFNAYMAKQPGGPTEVHSWISNIYAELRNFELRLLLGKLSASLGGVPTPRRSGQSAR